MGKGTTPQYPIEASSTGPVMVTRFRHEFRWPDEAILTWQVWGQARESFHRSGSRSRWVAFMARHRHGYAMQLQHSRGWEPCLKSKCQGKEGELLLRLLGRAIWREPPLRLLLSLSFKVLVLNPVAKPWEGKDVPRALTPVTRTIAWSQVMLKFSDSRTVFFLRACLFVRMQLIFIVNTLLIGYGRGLITICCGVAPARWLGTNHFTKSCLGFHR